MEVFYLSMIEMKKYERILFAMAQLINTNQIIDGDPKALEALITTHIPLVINVARRFQNNGLSFYDLINIGTWGLIKAAKNFDESRGFEFNNYATWHIRQSIIQAIMENELIKPIPLNRIGLLSKTHYPFIKPGYYLHREPGSRDMEGIKNFQKKNP